MVGAGALSCPPGVLSDRRRRLGADDRAALPHVVGHGVSAGDRDAYVYRILFNCFAKSRSRRWWGERASGEHLEHLNGIDSQIDIAETVTKERVVRDALRELPLEQRAVVVLRYYADLPEQQVAEVLGIAVGTVKSRSSRALSQLLTKLDGPSLSTRGRGKL